ncbi:MAG: CpaF family protein [Phototrophicales bacterium]|nr:CpaF family protein [Phototrophicales bacterium]
MGSFLKRVQQGEPPKKPNNNEESNFDDIEAELDLDARLDGKGNKKSASAPPPSDAKPEAKPDAKPKADTPLPQTGFSGTVKPIGVLDTPTTLDTGYVVPAKRRTSPTVSKLRKQLRPKLLAIPEEMDTWNRNNPEKQKIVVDRLVEILKKMSVSLTKVEFEELREGLLNDLLGFGAIEPLVQDKTYSEIMVNGSEVVFAEHKGKLRETEIVFDDEDHVLWTAQRIVRPLMRSLNRANPMVDARLPDGSRVHIVSQPSALCGTTMTIRKFPDKRLTVEDLVKFGSFPEDVGKFFEACVVSRLNVVVSGGTGSGKTTLLNVLSSFIPEDERIITVEDSAELNLAQRHVVRLETAPPIPGTEDEGRLEIRDLVKGTLRMRPDRLVIGECRSGEALDMLQAMNTGHDGSLTTVHSNSPRDAIGRLETLCMMAGMNLPIFVIRAQIASAVNLLVQQSRLKDGSRKVVQVTEIQGMEGESVVLQDIFVYRTEGQKESGYSHEGGGLMQATGFRPKFVDKFKQYGFNLPGRIFGAGQNKF